tara:strand:+ start:2611 stop:3153 length:543 start_codon:yes stop_codon:yes gene_type:complete
MDWKQQLEDECLRIEEDAILSMKTMFNERDALRRRHDLFTGVRLTLGGLSGGGVLYQSKVAYQSRSVKPWVLGGAALMQLFAFGLEVTSQIYSEKADVCHNIASEYDSLCSTTRFYRVNELARDESVESATAHVKELMNMRLDINKRRPSLWDRGSWKRAQYGASTGESIHEVDKKHSEG